MRACILISTSILLISCKNKEKAADAVRYTTANEHGLKGPVKKVTTFDYRETKEINGDWIPVDDSSWDAKRVMEFDKEGNIRQEITTTKPQGKTNSPLVIIAKHSYENGMHTAREYGGGFPLATLKYEWTGRTSYNLTSYNEDGTVNFRSKSELNNRFRDKAGEFMLFENDTLVYGFKYENTLDSNDRFVKATRTYVKPAKTEETYFSYKNFDEEGNATLGFMTQAGQPQPVRILKRTLEYYH